MLSHVRPSVCLLGLGRLYYRTSSIVQ